MRWRQTEASERLFVCRHKRRQRRGSGWAARILPPYGPKSSVCPFGEFGVRPGRWQRCDWEALLTSASYRFRRRETIDQACEAL